MELNELTHAIIGRAIEVHRRLGRPHLALAERHVPELIVLLEPLVPALPPANELGS